MSRLERHAERLAYCYPKQWRTRYGDEFTQLLLDELIDEPASLRREVDVIAHGLLTRLAYVGLVGSVLPPRRRLRVMLGALAIISAVFVALALGVWSQLTVGWAWSAPADPGTRAAISVMSVAVAGLGSVGILLAVPAAAVTCRHFRRSGGRVLWRPAVAALAAGVVLYVGCRHFGAHWPGSGGTSWSAQSLVPASVARMSWAATLWISAYWAHPRALSGFPAGEIAWMVLSPIAWLVLLASAVEIVRQIDLPPRFHCWAALMFCGAVAMMMLFLAGAGLWVLSQGRGPQNMFAVGTIDLAAIAMLTAALILATHLAQRVAAASLSGLSS